MVITRLGQSVTEGRPQHGGTTRRVVSMKELRLINGCGGLVGIKQR